MKLKSIKQIIILCFALLLIGISAANLIIGVIMTKNSINITVNDDLKSIGSTAEIAIQSSIDKYKFMIESIASQSFFGDDSLTQQQMLANLEKLKNDYGFESILFTDKNGANIISTDKSKMGGSIAEYEVFKRAMSGETTLSTPQKDINGEVNVFLNAKINNTNGYQGVVSATLNSQAYSNIIKDIVVNKSGNIFMVDKQGTMIANFRPELVDEQANFIEYAKTDKTYESAAALYSEMIAGKSDVGEYTFKGSDRICYYASIDGTDGWSYGVVAPIKEMTSSLKYTVYGLSISSIIFLIIGLIVAIKVAGSISKPIEKMSKRIQLLSEGDLSSDVETITRKDEIGILNQALINTVQFLRNYISEISTVLGKISSGELDAKVEYDYVGDFSSIKDSMEKIVLSLSDTMMEIKNSSEQVSSGSDQVSSGAQALSQGATEQASSIEELSATITEISEQVKRNAENASLAKSTTNEAKSNVEEGNVQMQDLIKAMAEISDTSNMVGKIIKTIDDIAFQTNILALNAAVEAARAGAAGKGFAVVAEEVRNLATKSAEAAKNTTGLIESTLTAIENGKAMADETANSLRLIVEGAEKSAYLINQIADASNEQANSISQVTLGVEQISAVVQTNSATAEESAAASEELSAQANILKHLLERFKINSRQSHMTSETKKLMNRPTYEAEYTEYNGGSDKY